MGAAVKKKVEDSYRCRKRGSRLACKRSGDDYALLGLVGGATLGATVGGFAGAIIGGAIGAAIGKEAR